MTADLGITRLWETLLGLGPGELTERMFDVFRGGSIGTVIEDEVHRALRERLGPDERRLAAFLDDLWREYLGAANADLIEYARRLRPRYRTARRREEHGSRFSP